MREKLKQKLKSRAGESISETLVALMIAALGLVMLAVAVTTTSDLVLTSRNRLDAYYAANEEGDGVVKMTGSARSGNVVLTDASNASLTGDGLAEQTLEVEYYVNDAFGRNPVVAYEAGR